MYRVPAAGPRQPAVAGPVERRVRPRPCSAAGTQALEAATDMQKQRDDCVGAEPQCGLEILPVEAATDVFGCLRTEPCLRR